MILQKVTVSPPGPGSDVKIPFEKNAVLNGHSTVASLSVEESTELELNSNGSTNLTVTGGFVENNGFINVSDAGSSLTFDLDRSHEDEEKPDLSPGR